MTLPEHIAVIGGGTMGAGIAHAFLTSGARVTIIETDDERAAAAVRRVEGYIAKSDERGSLTESREGVVARLRATTNTDGGATAGLFVEAVPESIDLKRAVLSRAQVSAPSAWLATNTSSLSPGDVAAVLDDPSRLIGLHFFNPVPASRLVEIIMTPHSAAELVQLARSWVADLGKESIVATDSPGFASSRLGVALALEAMRMVEGGVASAEDIDLAMELGYRHPVGPLRTTDLVGLDVRLAIAEYLSSELGPRFEPPEILRRLVRDGDIGRKSGRGFYEWHSPA